MCAKNCRPNGVAFPFQFCTYKIKPSVPNRCRNLFSKDDWRFKLADEPHPSGEEMAFVADTFCAPAVENGWQGQLPVQKSRG